MLLHIHYMSITPITCPLHTHYYTPMTDPYISLTYHPLHILYISFTYPFPGHNHYRPSTHIITPIISISRTYPLHIHYIHITYTFHTHYTPTTYPLHTHYIPLHTHDIPNIPSFAHLQLLHAIA